jgi:pSer/pThr/pTyr-binding forkhead associated (FHA) protein
MAGRTFGFVNNQLLFGRDDKECNVVFGNSNSAISRVHCRLTYNPSTNGFLLEDSSTNGTFLEGGFRIERGKSQSINKDDKFYLADTNNLFKVIIE